MRQNEMFELSFAGLPANGALTATFTWDGGTKTVEGFCAGEGVYKVRFLPQTAGEYRWETDGVIQTAGADRCVPTALPGIIRAEGKTFRTAAGALFHPFGTTVYALPAQPETRIRQTLDTLAAGPFNKLRLCVFPKSYDFCREEPEYFPFARREDGTWDTEKPVFAFWDRLDRLLTRLGELGIQADLILFHPYDRWGFDGMGAERDRAYLSYLLRRLAAYPHLWWSLANEYELTNRTQQAWDEIEAYVAAHDPYGHLLSCHNIFRIWDANRPLTTHASIQAKDLSRLEDWCCRYNTPVMLDECAYEGDLTDLWGSITGEEMTRRFWKAVCCGAYCTHGETFWAEDEVLWWAKGGVLKGKSPARIAFCCEIVESLPGHLEGERSFLHRLLALRQQPEQAVEAAAATFGEAKRAGMEKLIRAFLSAGEDAESFAASETVYRGHIGTDCFLRFYGTQPLSRDTLELPTDRRYSVSVLDVWNMTKETVATGVGGSYCVALPGRENMAVLALAEDF